MQFSDGKEGCFYFDFSTGARTDQLPRLRPKAHKARGKGQEESRVAQRRLVSPAGEHTSHSPVIVQRVFEEVNKERVRRPARLLPRVLRGADLASFDLPRTCARIPAPTFTLRTSRILRSFLPLSRLRCASQVARIQELRLAAKRHVIEQTAPAYKKMRSLAIRLKPCPVRSRLAAAMA